MLNTRVATLAISKRHNCPINSNRRYRAFRDKNRDPVPSTELRLALTDFVCGEYASSFDDVDDDDQNGGRGISAHELAGAVHSAVEVGFGRDDFAALLGLRLGKANAGDLRRSANARCAARRTAR